MEIGLDEKAPESCCFCHSQFDSSDDVQKKTEHVNTHLQSFNPVDPFNYKCPMCEQLFDKTEFTDEQFQSHVLTHFPEDNWLLPFLAQIDSTMYNMALFTTFYLIFFHFSASLSTVNY